MAWNEPSDYADPLAILIAIEENSDDVNTDELESVVHSNQSRAKTMEIERECGDTMGYSPAELAAQDWMH